MRTLHVACAVEGAYAPHSAAMLHSVAANIAPGRLHLHYLHGPDFPNRSAQRIEGMLARRDVAVTFHPVGPDRVAGLPVVDRFTAAMWYRIFLPEFLPDADRVLYLDVDTIAIGSLEPLWQINLDGYYVAAVTNVFMPHHVQRPRLLGLPGPESYFNSGVLLMNLDEMRRDACTDALRDYAIENGPALDWPDQDALNIVLGERRYALHPRWNRMNSLRFPWSAEIFGAEVVDEAMRRPAIRHFEGPMENKPWHRDSDRGDRRLYRRHRRKTPWPRVQLEGPRPSRLRHVERAVRLLGRR